MEGQSSFDFWFWQRVLYFIRTPRDWATFALICKDFAQFCRLESEERKNEFSIPLELWYKRWIPDTTDIGFRSSEGGVLPNGLLHGIFIDDSRDALFTIQMGRVIHGAPAVCLITMLRQIMIVTRRWDVIFYRVGMRAFMRGLRCDECGMIHFFDAGRYQYHRHCFQRSYQISLKHGPLCQMLKNPIARAVIKYAQSIK